MDHEKVVVVSLNRTATQSTDEFLKKLGYKTIHWVGQNFENFEINNFSTKRLYDIAVHAEKTYDAFSDLPFNYMYEHFDKNYKTKFILIKRPVNEWVNSVKKLYEKDFKLNKKTEFDWFEKTMFGKYIATSPNNINQISDKELEYFYECYHRDIDSYFINKDNLIKLDMYDLDKGTKICNFLNKPVRNDFDNIDYWRKFD